MVSPRGPDAIAFVVLVQIMSSPLTELAPHLWSPPVSSFRGHGSSAPVSSLSENASSLPRLNCRQVLISLLEWKAHFWVCLKKFREDSASDAVIKIAFWMSASHITVFGPRSACDSSLLLKRTLAGKRWRLRYSSPCLDWVPSLLLWPDSALAIQQGSAKWTVDKRFFLSSPHLSLSNKVLLFWWLPTILHEC